MLYEGSGVVFFVRCVARWHRLTKVHKRRAASSLTDYIHVSTPGGGICCAPRLGVSPVREQRRRRGKSRSLGSMSPVHKRELQRRFAAR